MPHRAIQRFVLGFLLVLLVGVQLSSGHQHHRRYVHAKSHGAVSRDQHAYIYRRANSTSNDSPEELVRKALLALTQIN